MNDNYLHRKRGCQSIRRQNTQQPCLLDAVKIWLNRKSILLSIMLSCILLLLASCSGRTLKPYAHSDFTANKINRLAVLPLQNLTTEKFAAKKIEGLLIMDFLSRGIDVIEPGEVGSALEELKMYSTADLTAAQLQNIGKKINADAVIIGSVGTFAINKGITVAYPEVSVHFILIDIASGNIVWSAWHTSGGPDFWTRHFGAEGDTLDEIAQKVVQETVDTLF